MASFISQLTDAMNLCSQPVERQVRTTIDPPMAPEEAMKLLKDRARGKGQHQPACWEESKPPAPAPPAILRLFVRATDAA